MTLRTSTLQGIELHLGLAKIGAGGKPLVGDSLRTLAPHEKNLSIFDSDSNKALRTHWDGNQLRFMRFPPVGITLTSTLPDVNIHDVMKLRIPKRWSRPMKKSKYPVSDEYIRNFGKRVKSNLWNKIWKARLPQQ